MSEENATPEQEPEQTPEVAATPEQVTPSESAPEEKPAKKPGWEKRIDVLTARLRETERELARRDAEPKAPAQQETAPNIDDFDSDTEFLAAVARHEAQQLYAKQTAEAQAQQAQQAREAEESEVASTVQKMFARGADVHDDFEAVVTAPSLPLTNEMIAALASTDNGHDIAYHLGKNPGEAGNISELSPVQQAIAIGRLGERLATTQKAVSKAPDPITPVDDTSAGTTDAMSDKSDIGSWMAARRAQLTA